MKLSHDEVFIFIIIIILIVENAPKNQNVIIKYFLSMIFRLKNYMTHFRHVTMRNHSLNCRDAFWKLKGTYSSVKMQQT